MRRCLSCWDRAMMRTVEPGSESQAQSLVGADRAFRVGLSLRDFVDCKSDMPSLF
jgi:hypothetical protein